MSPCLVYLLLTIEKQLHSVKKYLEFVYLCYVIPGQLNGQLNAILEINSYPIPPELFP